MLRKLLIILAFLSLWKMINPYNLALVQGRSMEPTLHDGQLFIIDRLAYCRAPVGRGDVIAFRHEGDIYIKRVIAVGGESLWLWVYPQKDGSELVTDAMAARLRRLATQSPSLGRLERRVVPAHCLFVVGDHRARSYDSRAFGPIPCSAVIGRARFF